MSLVRVSPIVLRHARTSLRKDQSEAATSLGIKKEELIKFETSTDLVEVSYPFLKKLSRVYKRPLAFFLLHKIPANIEPENDFRTLESVEIANFDTQMALVLRSAQNTRRKYSKLLAELDINHEVALPRIDMAQSPATQAQILREAVGVDIRTQLRWPNSEYIEARYKWCEAIESKGVLVLSHTFDVEEIRGFALSGHHLPPAIVYNSQDDYRASIFTIIHELAHVLITNVPANATHRDVETFCNAVAANFLVPESSLRTHLKYEKLLVSIQIMTDDTKSFDFWISRLASDYKVSRQVILRRAHDLGAVGPRVYKEKYSEYNIDYSDIVKKKEIQKQKRKEAGVSGGGESVSSKVVRNYGPTYTKTVIDALNTSRITNYQAAEYLGRIKTMHLGGIEEVFSKRYG